MLERTFNWLKKLGPLVGIATVVDIHFSMVRCIDMFAIVAMIPLLHWLPASKLPGPPLFYIFCAL